MIKLLSVNILYVREQSSVICPLWMSQTNWYIVKKSLKKLGFYIFVRSFIYIPAADVW
jgi:hypothetical protein